MLREEKGLDVEVNVDGWSINCCSTHVKCGGLAVMALAILEWNGGLTVLLFARDAALILCCLVCGLVG